MAYKVKLKSGETVHLKNATRTERMGNGTFFYDDNGTELASWSDGEVVGAYPADSEVDAAPAPANEGGEE